ncbi:host-nuclease inhibitor Gam family protein [Secundilactobacillus yichangensis]|uniref:host-nuclease inhibitor Gam family protein n=1 Tax=Secundilactobacillus yichangensis TaxID=2799580 RepID=UPI001943F078|nr:host-nuclease inhibitor Gam family protein [Secundilactobacillus yichangensis]
MMNPLIKDDLKDNSTEKKTFKVNDIGSATWAMRKLRAFDEQDKDFKRTAQDQIDSINAWLKRQLEANADGRSYLEGLLTDYMFEQRKKDPKFRINTPYGMVSTRKSPAGVNWSDKKVMESLEKQGMDDFIRIKKEPDKAKIKKSFKFTEGGKYVNEDGQIIEGATPKEATTKVTFHFNETGASL